MWLNTIKRKFSSTEVLDDDSRESQIPAPQTTANRPPPTQNAPDKAGLSLNMSSSQNVPRPPRKNPSPSAPSSPTKTLSLSAMMSAAKDLISTTSNNSSSATAAATSLFSSALPQNQRSNVRRKILLVIDEPSVEWSKYFRNKRIGDYELRIEQAEFKDMNLASYVDSGAIVDIVIDSNGSRVMRSFKPDFVLIRQHVKNLGEDWSNLIIGFKYGQIPSVNSLESIYNFRDKPWVFSELIKLANKYGHDAFPLINQTYYPNYKEMVRTSFPCVVKVGNAHQGLGKIQVRNALDFQDITSIVSSTNLYSTSEPFCESKCDIQIQKIGSHYKAYMKKSITGNWKSNTGSSMLEQIPMNDRYKFWVDEVSKLFGGLEMCTVQAIVDASSDKEYIIDVCDSAFTLLGEALDTDRKMIADLVYDKMITNFLIQTAPVPPPTKSTPTPQTGGSLSQSNSSDNTSQAHPHPARPPNPPPPPASTTPTGPSPSQSQNIQPQSREENAEKKTASKPPQNVEASVSAAATATQPTPQTTPATTTATNPPSTQHSSQPGIPPHRQYSVQSNIGSRQPGSNPIGMGKKTPLGETKPSDGSKKPISSSFSALDEAEDTMNNLRKTFAGIFGNSNI